MPDRENVIKGLESLRDICNAKSNMAIGKGKIAWAGYANTADAALVLLKEQEAVKPLKSKLSFTHGFDWKIWDCGCCGNQLRSFAKYCDQCGQAVKWDG